MRAPTLNIWTIEADCIGVTRESDARARFAGWGLTVSLLVEHVGALTPSCRVRLTGPLDAVRAALVACAGFTSDDACEYVREYGRML